MSSSSQARRSDQSIRLGSAILALVCTVAAPAIAADKTHEGTVVKAADGKLTMADKDGKNQTYAINKDTRIS